MRKNTNLILSKLGFKIKVMFRFFVFIFLSFIFINTNFHKALTEERKEFFNEVRGLGMGGAQIGTVNDGSAILINPAALGKLKEPTLVVIDPEISFNKEFLNVINFNLIRSFNFKKIFDKLKKEKGKTFHEKVQMFPSFTFTNFGFGLLAKYELNEEILVERKHESGRETVSSSSTKDLLLDYTNDLAFATGFSFRFFDGRIKLGVGLRFINRVEVNEKLDSNEIDMRLFKLATEGFGIGKDIGAVLTLPWVYVPSLSAVLRDVGDTNYDFLGGIFYDTDKRPIKTPQSLDLGFSFFSIMRERKMLSFSAELRDIFNSKEKGQSYRDDIMRRVHAGMEFNYHDKFFVRLGMNQMYWTLGFEMTRIYYQFQVAIYGEEIGLGKDRRESRRIVGKLSFRI